MERSEILERLNTVFQEQFDDDSIVVTDATTSADIEDWDSLEHIDLIVNIEKAFGMKFSMAETTGMKNVGEMVTILAARATK